MSASKCKDIEICLLVGFCPIKVLLASSKMEILEQFLCTASKSDVITQDELMLCISNSFNPEV